MKRLLIALLFLAVFVLGGLTVALSGSSPLSRAALADDEASDGVESIREFALATNINGESSSKSVRLRYLEAEGMPDVKPQAKGLYLSSDGDTLTLGQGAITVELDIEQTNDEEPITAVNAHHSGGSVEVVVTADTEILADVTEEPDILSLPDGHSDVDVQHELAPGSFDEIGDNMVVRAWGEWQGDQLIATILVYEPIR